MKVLVTGGAGYIGGSVCRLLLEGGHEVRSLDLLRYGDGGLESLEGKVESVVGDSADAGDLAAAMEGAEAVVHLAGTSGDPSCDLDPEGCRRDNLEATRLVAAEAARRGVGRVAFASSCSVYGAQDETADEASGPNPLTLYARTKLESEEAVLGLPGGAALRLSTLFGVSARTRCDLVVNLFTCQAVDRGRLVLFGGSQWRPLLHVEDAARAFVMALELPMERARGLYNVGGDDMNMRVRDIAAEVRGELPDTLVEVHPVDEDARSYRVSFARVRERWGFVPERSVADGIREVRAALGDGRIADWRAPECSTRGRVLR